MRAETFTVGDRCVTSREVRFSHDVVPRGRSGIVTAREKRLDGDTEGDWLWVRFAEHDTRRIHSTVLSHAGGVR